MNSPGAPACPPELQRRQEPGRRRPHLDWLRGIAVLIMIEAHTLDSWTRVADRSSPWYRWAIVVGGFGAPLFLFLAGFSLILAAASRVRKGLTTGQAARQAMRRGAWIFLLAFLFRLQALILGGGQFPQALLKVDILNVMGVSMLAGALALALARTVKARAVVFIVLTIAIAILTPAIRDSRLLDGLPDPLEAYLRPVGRLTTFTLFPWAGFFMGGCVAGLALEVEQAWFVTAGIALAAGGYLTSFLPQIFPHATFWTSSPTFFFLRLGILILSVPVAYGLSRVWVAEPLQEFGRASLFVYWVHVELVYGVASASIHRQLPLPISFVAFTAFSLAMFALVRLKMAIPGGRPTKSARTGRTIAVLTQNRS